MHFIHAHLEASETIYDVFMKRWPRITITGTRCSRPASINGRQVWPLDIPMLCTRVPRCSHFRFGNKFCLPSKVVHLKPDLLHCPAIPRHWLCAGVTPLVLTIHDVNGIGRIGRAPLFLILVSERWPALRRAILSRAALGAAAVISVSNFSRDDLLIACPNLSAEKVRVVPNGPGMSPGCRELPTHEIERFLGTRPTNLIFALGAVDPRKNTARVVTAFDAFNLRRPERILSAW